MTNEARNELGRQLVEAAHLSGRFLLRSGAYSDTYFDKYRFAADPSLLASVAKQLAEMLPVDTEVVAGIELGGVVLATALSISAKRPVSFVRKSRKEYGTCNIVEGTPVSGKNVVVIEDVISTGGQVIASVKQLRDAGARVDTVLCVVDRTNGNPEALREIGLQLHAVFTQRDLDAWISPPVVRQAAR